MDLRPLDRPWSGSSPPRPSPCSPGSSCGTPRRCPHAHLRARPSTLVYGAPDVSPVPPGPRPREGPPVSRRSGWATASATATTTSTSCGCSRRGRCSSRTPSPWSASWSRGTSSTRASAAIGVLIFFSVSGLLIRRSWEYDPSPRDFWIKRALRLLPALAVVGPGDGLRARTARHLGRPPHLLHLVGDLDLPGPDHAPVPVRCRAARACSRTSSTPVPSTARCGASPSRSSPTRASPCWA